MATYHDRLVLTRCTYGSGFNREIYADFLPWAKQQPLPTLTTPKVGHLTDEELHRRLDETETTLAKYYDKVNYASTAPSRAEYEIMLAELHRVWQLEEEAYTYGRFVPDGVDTLCCSSCKFITWFRQNYADSLPADNMKVCTKRSLWPDIADHTSRLVSLLDETIDLYADEGTEDDYTEMAELYTLKLKMLDRLRVLRYT